MTLALFRILARKRGFVYHWVSTKPPGRRKMNRVQRRSVAAFCVFLFAILLASYGEEEKGEAPYYRFWRGFKKAGLSMEDFHHALVTDFMPVTVKTHGKEGLVSYMVVLPPGSGTKVIPDEIALVAYASENTYKTITRTPHGLAYQKKHGDIFTGKGSPGSATIEIQGSSRASRSLVPIDFASTTARDFHREQAYDVFRKPVDWQTGHSIFFYGFRKPSLRPDFFWDALYKHVSYVRTAFTPFGLKGYVILVTQNEEIAFMNWDSKEGMEKALQSPQGKALVKDAMSILDTLLWKDFRGFDGTLNPGDCINYQFPRP